MIKKRDINQISQLLNENKIKEYKLISSSFDINCVKVTLENKKRYIIKYYNNKKKNFNAIDSELKNLIFLKKNIYIFFQKFLLKIKNIL